MNWTHHNSYIIGNYVIDNNHKYDNKIAGFDLDNTLIKTKSGNIFPKNSDDWVFLYFNTVSKIRELYNDGFYIKIITNQKNLKNMEEWKQKIVNICKIFDINIDVYVSLLDDTYRKPRVNLWTEYIGIYTVNTFYCGDACGRNSDHNDTDFKFALNLKIKFMSPEYLFLSQNDISSYSINYPEIQKINIHKYLFNKYNNNQELVLLIGPPGSGKSYYSKNYINDYEYINRDTEKTINKCLKLCENYIRLKKNVVIDNTNPSKKSRKIFIDIAKKYNVQIRCILFITPIEICMHNNIYRNMTTHCDLVPKIAYNIFKKNYEKPSDEEGFVRIEEHEFILNTDEIDKDIYFMYLY